MSLENTLKELDQQIKGIDDNEDANKQPSNDQEVVEEGNDEAQQPEQKPEEAPTKEEIIEDDDSEDADDELKDKTSAAMARMRREKAEAERKARELQERLEKLEKANTQKLSPEQEQVSFEEKQRQFLTQIALKEKMQEAKEELTEIEAEFLREAPDYEDVKNYAIEREIKALKRRYPDTPESQLKKQIERDLLFFAADFHAKGKNPAEEIYHFAKERYGYAGGKAKSDPEPAVNMAAIRKNKAKSTNLMDAAGKPSKNSPLSSREISEMTVADQYRAAKEGIWE